MLLWGQKERREREIHTFCRGKRTGKKNPSNCSSASASKSFKAYAEKN